jgi:hypothetical protein
VKLVAMLLLCSPQGYLLALQLAGAGIAHADPAPIADPPKPDAPDPAARRAGDANLEPTGQRHGLTLSAAIGAALTVGVGLSDSVGRGGAVSLRVGQTMTENSVLTVELQSTTVLREVGTDHVTNQDTNFMVGAQYFIGSSLFLRFAGGIGDYIRNKVDSGMVGVLGTRKVAGPVGIGSGGLDYIHSRHVSLDFELFVLGMPNRDGFLLVPGFGLGGSYY